MEPLTLRLQVALPNRLGHGFTNLSFIAKIPQICKKYFISIFHKVFSSVGYLFSENICDFDLFIAAPGCMSDFFPNPQQLEIFDASSEQIHCSLKFVPCVLHAQYENYLNKYMFYFNFSFIASLGRVSRVTSFYGVFISVRIDECGVISKLPDRTARVFRPHKKGLDLILLK